MSNTIRIKRGTTEPTAGALVTGELAINTADGNLYSKLDDGTVSNVIAKTRRLTATVRNESGSTINAFNAVYINGASGNKATVVLAQANSEATSSKTFAVTATSISDNNNGEVVVSGLLEKIDTSSFTAGDGLWLSPSTAGGFTTTRPSAPDNAVFIGVVTRSHATQGAVEIKIQNGYEIEELHNVSITSPSNGQVLTYNSSTGLWYNAAPSGGGGGASAIPAYNNGVTYTVGQQVIFSDRFWYMSTAVGGAGYDPIGYPSYWTEISASGGGGGGGTWGSITGTVTDQTDLTSYISGELGNYLPLAGGTVTGAIAFDSTGGQNINKGSFDNGMGGYNGISLYCAVGYELNWQGGWLTSSYWFGSTGFLPIKIDSGAGSTLQVFDKSTGIGTEITHTGITFPDSTSQTTAGIADAPSDGTNYGRLNGAWAATLPEAPSDGTQYVRQNGSWTANSGFTFGDSPSDGNYYVRMGNTGWAQIGNGTDTIATQNYVTSQGYATTGDVSTAVSGLVSAANARKQAFVESARAVLNDSAYGFDGSGYYYTSFMSGAFNYTVTNSQFSSSGKWFGFKTSGTIYSAMSISLSGGVVTITAASTSVPDVGTGLFYTEDGGTTWFESTIPVSA